MADADFITAAGAETIEPVYAAYFDFESGGRWFSTAAREFTLPADGTLPEARPVPLGNAAGFERLENRADAISQTVRLSVSGVDRQLLGIALSENVKNRFMVLQMILLEGDSDAIAGRTDLFIGTMEKMNLAAGQGAAVVIDCIDWLAAFSRPDGLTYSAADQKALVPGDAIFDGAEVVGDVTVPWGRAG